MGRKPPIMNKGDIVRPTANTLLHYKPEEEGNLLVLDSFMDGAYYLSPTQKTAWLSLQSLASGKKYNSEAFHFELITSPSDGAKTT